MSHLDQAYNHVLFAHSEFDDVLAARSHFRQAADELRAAKALDLARYAEHELDLAIGAPYSESLLDAIDKRALRRRIARSRA